MKLFITTFLIIYSVKLFSCGNENYIRLTEVPLQNGKINLTKLLFESNTNGDDIILPYWTYGHKDDLIIRLVEMEVKYKKTKDHKLLSDIAWVKIKLGKAQEMIPVLDSLYRLYPNDYNIIANLGTAYELEGNNDKSLELIKKAIAINPKSHFNSEWIHIKILEAKLKNESSLSELIGLNANSFTYQYDHWIKDQIFAESKADSIMLSIAYQLHERIHFVKAPNKIVGQLLLDFADLVAKRYSVKEAIPFFVKAVAYDNNLANVVNNRLNSSNFFKSKNEANNDINVFTKSNKYLFWLLGVSILLIVTWFLLKKIKKQKSNNY